MMEKADGRRAVFSSLFKGLVGLGSSPASFWNALERSVGTLQISKRTAQGPRTPTSAVNPAGQ